MRRFFVFGGGALAAAAFAVACGGSSGPSTPTPTPGNPTPQPITIDILGDRGNQSFSPNPAQDNSSNMAVWRNTDSEVHRIVANDGSFDTGNISAGASSGGMRIAAEGTNYHCSLHPGMVGTIRASAGTAPPCTGLYC